MFEVTKTSTYEAAATDNLINYTKFTEKNSWHQLVHRICYKFDQNKWQTVAIKRFISLNFFLFREANGNDILEHFDIYYISETDMP